MACYEDLSNYLCSILVEENDRLEFKKQAGINSLIAEMENHDDLLYERHVLCDGNIEWEHLNIICLERKNGKACKVLFIRQDITEVKEKELRIEAEMSLASRKERQYRIAITSNSICTFDFNLTQDSIEEDIIRVIDGKKISLLEKTGLKAPCKASGWLERWKKFVSEESMQDVLFYCRFKEAGRTF